MNTRHFNQTVITEMKLITRNMIMMLAGALCLALTFTLAGCSEDSDDSEHVKEGHNHVEGEEDDSEHGEAGHKHEEAEEEEHDHDEGEEGQSEEHEGHGDEEGQP